MNVLSGMLILASETAPNLEALTTQDWVGIVKSLVLLLGGGLGVLLFWIAKRVSAHEEVCGYMKHNVPQLWDTYDEFRKGNPPESPRREARQPPPG